MPSKPRTPTDWRSPMQASRCRSGGKEAGSKRRSTLLDGCGIEGQQQGQQNPSAPSGRACSPVLAGHSRATWEPQGPWSRFPAPGSSNQLLPGSCRPRTGPARLEPSAAAAAGNQLGELIGLLQSSTGEAAVSEHPSSRFRPSTVATRAKGGGRLRGSRGAERHGQQNRGTASTTAPNRISSTRGSSQSSKPHHHQGHNRPAGRAVSLRSTLAVSGNPRADVMDQHLQEPPPAGKTARGRASSRPRGPNTP